MFTIFTTKKNDLTQILMFRCFYHVFSFVCIKLLVFSMDFIILIYMYDVSMLLYMRRHPYVFVFFKFMYPQTMHSHPRTRILASQHDTNTFICFLKQLLQLDLSMYKKQCLVLQSLRILLMFCFLKSSRSFLPMYRILFRNANMVLQQVLIIIVVLLLILFLSFFLVPTQLAVLYNFF